MENEMYSFPILQLFVILTVENLTMTYSRLHERLEKRNLNIKERA